MPRVSVVMAAYNHGRFVAQAVQSVLDQTFTDWELVVVDDHSTDNTPQVLAQFDDPRLTVLRQPRNGGAGLAINRGLELAAGEMVALLDADDWCLPHRLARQVAALDERPDVGAVFCQPLMVNETGEPIAYERLAFERENRSRQEWLRFLFFRGGFALSASLLMRRALLAQTGFFDPRFCRQVDIEFHVRLLLATPVWLIEEKLYAYRRLAGELNNSAFTPAARRAGALEFFAKYENFLAMTRPAEVVAALPVLGEMYPQLVHPAPQGEDPLLSRFLVGMAAICTRTPMIAAFGLATLHDLMASAPARARLAREFDFGLAQLKNAALMRDVYQRFAREI